MTDANDTTRRVRDAVESLEATIIGVTDQGGVEFTLDDIDGFARARRGKLRISFFIAVDPDPAEAELFVSEHDGLPSGEAQFAELDDGSIIRLLVEMPFNSGDEILIAAETARALRAGWVNRDEAGADLLSTLGADGIALPPLGTVDLADVRTYGAWSWGSRYIPPFVLYMFEVQLVARQIIDHGPFFALAHAGHGFNSYGLSLVTGAGPVAAYVQHGYGGAYSNPLRDLIEINATYSRLHVLLRAASRVPSDDVRWLIAYSQFRGGAGIIDLARVRGGEVVDQAVETYDSEPEICETLVERLSLDNFDLGAAGSVSW